MSDELKHSLQEVAYKSLLKYSPDLIPIIRETVNKGESVRPISKLAEELGSPLVAGLIEQAAEYIKRTRPTQEPQP